MTVESGQAQARSKPAPGLAQWLRDNGLTIALTAAFAFSIGAMALTGWSAHNQELSRHGSAGIGLLAYLGGGKFLSAVFENWESEFLQMGMYVLLTVKLRQRGSAESRPMAGDEDEEEIKPGPTPRLAKAAGLGRWLYANSLAIAFGLMFLISFVLHLEGSWRLELSERMLEGEPPVSMWNHFTGATFWFESFQNWQSEFLAVLALVVLSIFLRQDKSPQSKPVAAPHCQTGA